MSVLRGTGITPPPATRSARRPTATSSRKQKARIRERCPRPGPRPRRLRRRPRRLRRSRDETESTQTEVETARPPGTFTRMKEPGDASIFARRLGRGRLAGAGAVLEARAVEIVGASGVSPPVNAWARVCPGPRARAAENGLASPGGRAHRGLLLCGHTIDVDRGRHRRPLPPCRPARDGVGRFRVVGCHASVLAEGPRRQASPERGRFRRGSRLLDGKRPWPAPLPRVRRAAAACAWVSGVRLDGRSAPSWCGDFSPRPLRSRRAHWPSRRYGPGASAPRESESHEPRARPFDRRPSNGLPSGRRTQSARLWSSSRPRGTSTPASSIATVGATRSSSVAPVTRLHALRPARSRTAASKMRTHERREESQEGRRKGAENSAGFLA